MQHGADYQADDRHGCDASQPKPDEVTGTRQKLAHLDLLSKARSPNPPVPSSLLSIPDDVRSRRAGQSKRVERVIPSQIFVAMPVSFCTRKPNW